MKLRLITAAVLITLFFLVFIYLPNWVLSCGLGVICLILLATEWPVVGIWWLTPFYPTLPFVLLIMLNQAPEYHHLVLFAIALSGSFDMGAFFIGSFFGKHRIAPRISPKKTYEGLVGGFAFTYLTSLLLLHVFSINFSVVLLALIASGAAFFGDLFASWLKRRAGVKDTGKILPGHGGLLDRFDSILFVVIILFSLRNSL